MIHLINQICKIQKSKLFKQTNIFKKFRDKIYNKNKIQESKKKIQKNKQFQQNVQKEQINLHNLKKRELFKTEIYKYMIKPKINQNQKN